MPKIKALVAREILNSKGIPTIETTVTLQNEVSATASSPSGISIGTYEAVELRDQDMQRYKGMGVLRAVNNVTNIIAPKLINMEITKQREIDKLMIEMDGTQNKGRLGANAILSVSMAVCKAASLSSNLPVFMYLRQFLTAKNTQQHIPTPLFNILEGGLHATNSSDFQEFIVIPSSSTNYSDGLMAGSNIYSSLKLLLRKNGFSEIVGDEGGFGPKVNTNYDALSLVREAIEQTNHRVGFDIFIGLDASANFFHDTQGYLIKDKNMRLSSKDLINYYIQLQKEFNIIYLEDILSEDDWDGWTQAMTALSKSSLIVGDDLTVTNPFRLQMALDKKAINGVVVKLNQIGTVTEAVAVVEVAKQAGLKVIVSNRGAETNEDFIADFAVAVGADYIKVGGLSRGERIAKYNRLSQINDRLNSLK